MQKHAEKTNPHHRPKIGDWKPGQDLINWNDDNGLSYGRAPSGCDYRISGKDHCLMQFDKNGVLKAQKTPNANVVAAKLMALDLELLELGKKAPRNLVSTLQLRSQNPAGAAVVHEAHADTQASLEDRMAEQLGGFVSKRQAAQKAVDAELLAVTPFPQANSGSIVKLDIEQLFESPKNPRQDFDEEDIEGLAQSIVKTGGLMVAILARPIDNNALPYPDSNSIEPHYEIADGARRFRALKLLKKQKNPLGEKALVDIRPLTDAQLAEAFMTADRRKTLNPVEQARGFKNMLDVGHTVDTIATSLGISKGTVHGRLKLLELGKLALKLMGAGTLPPALATVIGRYPERLQEEALTRLLDGDDRDTGEGTLWHAKPGVDPWSAKQTDKVLVVGACMEHLQEHFTKSLKTTPFDQKDETLQVPVECWPERWEQSNGRPHEDSTVTAPACGGCPKNSRNMAKEVAGEDTRGDGKFGFCTGLACYQAKWDATLEQLRAKAKETGAIKVLTPAQSAKALRSGHMAEARYAKASEVVHEHPKKLTLGQLQAEVNKGLEEGEQLRTVIATTEDGKVEMVEKTELLKVLAAQGKKWAKKEQAASKGYDYAAAQRRDEAKRKIRGAVGHRVLAEMVQQIREKGPDLPLLRAMVEDADVYGYEDAEREVFGVKSQKDLEAFVEKKATQSDLIAMLYGRLLADDFSRGYGGYSDELLRAAKVRKLDLKKLEAEEKKKLADPAAADIPGGDDDE
jgi:ParB/RepB/Spo0J family partition protein